MQFNLFHAGCHKDATKISWMLHLVIRNVRKLSSGKLKRFYAFMCRLSILNFILNLLRKLHVILLYFLLFISSWYYWFIANDVKLGEVRFYMKCFKTFLSYDLMRFINPRIRGSWACKLRLRINIKVILPLVHHLINYEGFNA